MTAMNEKQSELIAIGAAVTANCVPCLRFHLGKAIEAGVSEAEIADAIRIGRKVRSGSARAWDEEASEIFPEAGT